MKCFNRSQHSLFVKLKKSPCLVARNNIASAESCHGGSSRRMLPPHDHLAHSHWRYFIIVPESWNEIPEWAKSYKTWQYLFRQLIWKQWKCFENKRRQRSYARCYNLWHVDFNLHSSIRALQQCSFSYHFVAVLRRTFFYIANCPYVYTPFSIDRPTQTLLPRTK